MTDSNTLDKITSWASDKYASTPASVGTTPGASASPASGATPASTSDGLLSAAAASPATTPGGTTASAAPSSAGMSSASSTPSANVSDWYRAALGRDGDAGGISYWQNALKNGANASDVYNDFLSSAGTNHEAVKSGIGLSQANSYNGPTSNDGSTSVDEWGNNVLGRNLTSAETSQWKAALAAAKTPDDANKVYSDFLAANQGSVKNNLSLAGASQINPAAPSNTPAPAAGAVTVSPDQLAVRNVDKPTETVQGQLGTILAADNPVLQQARAEGMRTAFDRGLGNSSIAASAGEDALIRAATGIATTDAGTYNNAANYNTAAQNQAVMYNAEQQNEFNKLKLQYGDAEASRIMQEKIAQMQNDTTKSGQAQQMTIAQMQDQTNRWQTEQQTANSRYNTDSQYKQQVDNQKLGVANNIIQNMDLSPDRKAAMLEQLGFGTMAKPGTPGTGLAGAVYVIDSTSSDLANLGPMGSVMAGAAGQARAGG